MQPPASPRAALVRMFAGRALCGTTRAPRRMRATTQPNGSAPCWASPAGEGPRAEHRTRMLHGSGQASGWPPWVTSGHKGTSRPGQMAQPVHVRSSHARRPRRRACLSSPAVRHMRRPTPHARLPFCIRAVLCAALCRMVRYLGADGGTVRACVGLLLHPSCAAALLLAAVVLVLNVVVLQASMGKVEGAAGGGGGERRGALTEALTEGLLSHRRLARRGGARRSGPVTVCIWCPSTGK